MNTEVFAKEKSEIKQNINIPYVPVENKYLIFIRNL